MKFDSVSLNQIILILANEQIALKLVHARVLTHARKQMKQESNVRCLIWLWCVVYCLALQHCVVKIVRFQIDINSMMA